MHGPAASHTQMPPCLHAQHVGCTCMESVRTTCCPASPCQFSKRAGRSSLAAQAAQDTGCLYAGIYDTRRYHPAAPGAEKDVTSKRTASKAGSTEAANRVMCAECGQQALPWGAGLLCSQCRVRDVSWPPFQLYGRHGFYLPLTIVHSCGFSNHHVQLGPRNSADTLHWVKSAWLSQMQHMLL